jgi:hypothetical protein
MATGRAIVPPVRGEGFVELARSRKGRVFEKQILNYGDLLYPGVKGGKVHIDDEWADKLITNFSNGVCDIVQVPKAGPNNEHTEDPDRNIGEVIGLVKRNGKIYAHLDARDAEAAEKLGKTLLGASAMLHLDYTDTKTGSKVGPTLLHVAVTNRPYITGLEDFEEVLAASADGSGEEVVMLTATDNQEGSVMTLEELLAELKSEHGIDVAELQTKAEQSEMAAALSNKIETELGTAGVLTLSNGEKATADELINAIGEAGQKIVSLSSRVDELVEKGAKDAAASRVEGLVRSGHILPKNKDAQIELLLSNSDLFEKLLPEKPLVKLSNNEEDGEAGFHVEDDQQKQTVEAEVARLTQVADQQRGFVRS